MKWVWQILYGLFVAACVILGYIYLLNALI
jgi:hypothetical protein